MEENNKESCKYSEHDCEQSEQTKIIKIERIESLQSPEWERQEGESELWHQRFFLYYINQVGNRSIKRAMRSWAAANEIRGDARLKAEYREWKSIAERNLWLEREIAFEEYQGKVVSAQEYDVLERFKSQGLRISEGGMASATNAIAMTSEVFRQYVESLAKDEKGRIDFELLDANQYSKIVSAMKTSADTANTMIEIGNKMLALDKVLGQLLDNGEVSTERSDEWED